jgi:hypothetical protein
MPLGCRQAREMLVEAPARAHVVLSLVQESPRGLRVAVGEHGVAGLVVGVRLERQARRLGIELKRGLAFPGQFWVVAKERPVTGLDRGLLLVHAVAQIVAVGDAVAVGDDERRPGVGLGLAERLEGLASLPPMATRAT